MHAGACGSAWLTVRYKLRPWAGGDLSLYSSCTGGWPRPSRKHTTYCSCVPVCGNAALPYHAQLQAPSSKHRQAGSCRLGRMTLQPSEQDHPLCSNSRQRRALSVWQRRGMRMCEACLRVLRQEHFHLPP